MAKVPGNLYCTKSEYSALRPLNGQEVTMRLVDAVLRHLLEKGKATGSVTFGDVHEALMENNSDPTHLDMLVTALEEAGIAVIDEDEE